MAVFFYPRHVNMNEDLTKLLELFKQIEPLQKQVEAYGRGLDGPALNETRNATYHLLLALRSESAAREDQIGKAERHAQRAIYDCHEAMILKELNTFRVFKEDYRNIEITPVLPSYLAFLQIANDAQSKIEDGRKENGENREKFYAELRPCLDSIRDINKKCVVAREELNKTIDRYNSNRAWSTLGKIGSVVFALVTLAIALVAWLYPQTPS